MNAQPQATELASGNSFDSLPLATFLKETIRSVGYTTPTPIQADSIPLIIEGRDVIGLAQTGTGKTAAFVLPLLQNLSGSKERGVRALILAPTRELAEQINDVIKTFAGRTGVKSTTVYGGVSHRNQITQLRYNPQIVVACPGRLMDHIHGKTIDLSTVQYLVLDEADRMLDMGFMPDIKAIIKQLPAERQTMLFSATMPEEIADLSKTVLKDPTTVRVKTEQPIAAISHSMYSVTQEAKGETLASWLQANNQALAVVFTKMKHTAKRLGDRLTKAGVPATSLHGNLSQGQRQKALQGFRDGKFRVLIATDIASRGIDVEGVTHVVNYDMPDTLEAYIHRTGRAGRAAREGDAVSFVTRADRAMVRSIEQWLKTPLNRLNTESALGADAQTQEEGEGRTRERQGRRPQTRSRGREDRKPAGRGSRVRNWDGANDDSRVFRGKPQGRKRTFDRAFEDSGEQRASRPERSGTSRQRPMRDDNRSFRPKRDGFQERSFDGRRSEMKPGEGSQRPFRKDRRSDGFSKGGAKRFERRDNLSNDRTSRERSGAGPERFDRNSSDRGFRRDRPQREDRADSRKPFGSRGDSNRRGARGERGASNRGRAFRGQQDIDQKADYVYREAQPHFIDLGNPEAPLPRRPRPNGARPRSGGFKRSKFRQ